MTETEQFNEILKALAEVIQEKNSKISIQNWQIETLKKELKECERIQAEKSGIVCKRRISRKDERR